MQVWYLLGWAWHLRGDAVQAGESLVHARDLFDKNKCEVGDVRAHIEELLGHGRGAQQAPTAME